MKCVLLTHTFAQNSQLLWGFMSLFSSLSYFSLSFLLIELLVSLILLVILKPIIMLNYSVFNHICSFGVSFISIRRRFWCFKFVAKLIWFVFVKKSNNVWSLFCLLLGQSTNIYIYVFNLICNIKGKLKHEKYRRTIYNIRRYILYF